MRTQGAGLGCEVCGVEAALCTEAGQQRGQVASVGAEVLHLGDGGQHGEPHHS